jgi:hypothetical protein
MCFQCAAIMHLLYGEFFCVLYKCIHQSINQSINQSIKDACLQICGCNLQAYTLQTNSHRHFQTLQRICEIQTNIAINWMRIHCLALTKSWNEHHLPVTIPPICFHLSAISLLAQGNTKHFVWKTHYRQPICAHFDLHYKFKHFKNITEFKHASIIIMNKWEPHRLWSQAYRFCKIITNTPMLYNMGTTWFTHS